MWVSTPQPVPATPGRRRRSRLHMVSAATALIVSVACTTGFALARAESRHRPAPIPAASAFALPSATRCISGHALEFRVRKLHGVKWVSVTVEVNGKRLKTIRGAALGKPIKLTGLPGGRFVVSITARARGGRSAKANRTYEACSAPVDGFYTGSNGQNGNGISLYVAAGGTSIQDVYDNGVALACKGGGGYTDHLGINAVTVAADGSFSSTSAQTSLFGSRGVAATYTYTFQGHFHGTNAAGYEVVAGTYREDITYNNGASSCTSGDQSWSATLKTPAAGTAVAPPAGSYSGSNGQNGNGISLYVAVGGTAIQDVYDNGVALSCMGGGGYGDHLGINAITVAADGSFSSTSTQTGLFGSRGMAATYTYRYQGHFHGRDAAGYEVVAGTYREDISYNNGASSCTSGDQSWSAKLNPQPAQSAGTPPARSYSGSNGQNGNGISFYVAAGGTQIQNVYDNGVGLSCQGGGGYTGHLSINAVTVASDGSFSSVTTASGVVSGSSATFTYTFQGHFHGTNSAGHERAAGTYREDITYNNGNSSCTSNDQSWSATG
jgi:hypothetical protein